VISGQGSLPMKDGPPLPFVPGAYASLPSKHVHQAICTRSYPLVSVLQQRRCGVRHSLRRCERAGDCRGPGTCAARATASGEAQAEEEVSSRSIPLLMATPSSHRGSGGDIDRATRA
jgi:hypothetical protein